MKIYICEKCKFSFERSGIVEECPDCGRSFVREATEDEAAEHQKNKTEFEKAYNCQ